ncbi:hypothetical protein AA309_13250 [Microvirga vignae]|uniref:Uncharacterized protein n=1 Tax=Microvirga vignae TaxID=1225564 RepID=A0A0H1RC57_9HYPH|nr:hypothetical protein AA309_13250 [Microvirga vignae]
MKVGSSADHTQNSKDRGWRQILGPQDAENVLLVIMISWVSAAGALVFFGKFDLILLLVTAGFVAVLVVLSSGLSLLTAAALRKLTSWFA